MNASDKIYEQDDLGPVQSIKNSLSFILTQITQTAQFLQDNEYEITKAAKAEEKVTLFIISDVFAPYKTIFLRWFRQFRYERRQLKKNYSKQKH